MIPGDAIFVLIFIAAMGIVMLVYYQERAIISDPSYPSQFEALPEGPVDLLALPVPNQEQDVLSEGKDADESIDVDLSDEKSQHDVRINGAAIYTDEWGNELFRADLSDLDVEDLLLNNKWSPFEMQLKEKVEELQKNGKYKQAHQLLSQQPKDLPIAEYLRAKNLLYRGKNVEAMSKWERLDRRYPDGFFDVKPALFTLRSELRGELSQGTFVNYLLMEGMDNSRQKVSVIKRMLKHQPGFALGWEALARLLLSPHARVKAVDQGLGCDCDIETHSKLKIHEAELKFQEGDEREGIRMLGGLIFDPYVTRSMKVIAKIKLRVLLGIE